MNLCEPTLTTVAKKLHGVNPDREIDPGKAEEMLFTYFGNPSASLDLAEDLTDHEDQVLTAWFRQYLNWR